MEAQHENPRNPGDPDMRDMLVNKTNERIIGPSSASSEDTVATKDDTRDRPDRQPLCRTVQAVQGVQGEREEIRETNAAAVVPKIMEIKFDYERPLHVFCPRSSHPLLSIMDFPCWDASRTELWTSLHADLDYAMRTLTRGDALPLLKEHLAKSGSQPLELSVVVGEYRSCFLEPILCTSGRWKTFKLKVLQPKSIIPVITALNKRIGELPLLTTLTLEICPSVEWSFRITAFRNALELTKLQLCPRSASNIVPLRHRITDISILLTHLGDDTDALITFSKMRPLRHASFRACNFFPARRLRLNLVNWILNSHLTSLYIENASFLLGYLHLPSLEELAIVQPHDANIHSYHIIPNVRGRLKRLVLHVPQLFLDEIISIFSAIPRLKYLELYSPVISGQLFDALTIRCGNCLLPRLAVLYVGCGSTADDVFIAMLESRSQSSLKFVFGQFQEWSAGDTKKLIERVECMRRDHAMKIDIEMLGKKAEDVSQGTSSTSSGAKNIEDEHILQV